MNEYSRSLLIFTFVISLKSPCDTYIHRIYEHAFPFAVSVLLFLYCSIIVLYTVYI